MTSEIEALADIDWGTVVFDEAHALKNDRAQRTAAARRLCTNARVGLTGTPVENRVQELRSLFSVLVPGLLGPKSSFDQSLSEPIAKGDPETAQLLRRIIHPFVLRRTKDEVLDELPPRTEVTVTTEPTPEQAAYYEARRQRAKDRLDRAKLSTASPADRAFLLAEIQKLRQIAVDPQLLDDPEAPPGAKLDAVVEHVVERARHGHRALVFTQFLGSLQRLAGRLRAAGLSVRLVDRFQSGSADVFVLSLRAGGIGMNLTAADHVVHIDPWWNPAVEDQATDRSHRIGQVKPVTVARFVTEGTIEAKILQLHAAKRAVGG